jgi:hypothetical protein
MSSHQGKVFIISVPAAAAGKIAGALPPGFDPVPVGGTMPELRFGIAELKDYVGLVKDLAQLAAAVITITAALRAAGGGKIAVRAATATEPVEIDADLDEAAIRAKLEKPPAR